MAGLGADAQAQIVANSIIGIIAVVGSIAGAILGANRGAEATRKATTDAIAAEREATQEQRRHEDRVALRALATECRMNAEAMRQKVEYRPDPRFTVPLRQVAFDAATSALAELPTTVRDAVFPILQEVLRFNQLVTTRMNLVDISTGDTVARALMNELEAVGTALPPRLDKVADTLDAATQ